RGRARRARPRTQARRRRAVRIRADVFTKKANADYLKSKGYCKGDGCFIYGYWGYVPVKDSDYKTVRDVCATTGDPQCKAGS
ncbi:hypothetical protein ACWEWX_50880, partial [Streptomyces asiaticus]